MREIVRFTGPYLSKSDGRQQVCVYFSDGTRKSMWYARYLMTLHLGRELSQNEHVDHIDGDKTNDVLSNLQVLAATDNLRKRWVETGEYKGVAEYDCPICLKSFERAVSMVESNQGKRGMPGPFCSNPCAAKHRMLQRSAEWYYFACPVCGVEAKKRMKNVKSNWKAGFTSGPYCGRSCAAKKVTEKN